MAVEKEMIIKHPPKVRAGKKSKNNLQNNVMAEDDSNNKAELIEEEVIFIRETA